jgi:hypothetical protein
MLNTPGITGRRFTTPQQEEESMAPVDCAPVPMARDIKMLKVSALLGAVIGGLVGSKERSSPRLILSAALGAIAGTVACRLSLAGRTKREANPVAGEYQLPDHEGEAMYPRDPESDPTPQAPAP